MKNIYRIISAVSAVALLLGVSSCVEKAPAYEPAATPATDEVYFPQGQPSNVDLKLAGGSFDVNVRRIKATSAADVALNVTASDIFTVPSSVSFAAGQDIASFTITYDPADLEDDASYPFEIALASQTSEYGIASYSFNGIVPASWIKWGTGHMTEGWWGEEEDETLYYQDLGNGIWYCYISDCFDTEGGAPPTNYYFYWDQTTNFLSIPMQWMGYTNSDGYKVYVGDPESFYRNVYDYDDDLLIKNGYEGVVDYAYSSDPRPYYDGNGGFFFYVWYYFSKEDKKGSGYDFGSSYDVFIGDGFVRTVDYNKDYDYNAAYAAVAMSESLNGDIFETTVSVAAKDSTVYYASDYFAEGSGLAFIIPEDQWDDEAGRIMDGAEIVAGENEQFTGVDVWGKELVANIGKKSKVSWPADEEYPTFNVNVTLSLYSYELDEEGNRVDYEKAYELGTFADVIAVTGPADVWFTADDISGLKKEYYIGDFIMQAHDYFNDQDVMWNMSVEDGGEDEDGTSWLIFNKFAPYNATAIPDNRLYVEWYNGILYLPASQFEGGFVYNGAEYPLYVYPMSTKTGYYYKDEYLIFGYYYNEDTDAEAIVGVDYPYNDVPVDGVFLDVQDLGGLAAFNKFAMLWADEASVKAIKPVRSYGFSDKYKVRMLNIPSSAKKMEKAVSTKSVAKPAAPKASVQSAAVSARTINTSNARPVLSSEKNFKVVAISSKLK